MIIVDSFAKNLESPVHDGPPRDEPFGPGSSSVMDGEQEEMAVETDDEDTLRWQTNLFTLYARVFRVMLAKWKETRRLTNEDEKTKELEDLTLPSNEEWRYQVYYRLVELQRENDPEIADFDLRMNAEVEVETKQRKYWDWEPNKRALPLRPKSGSVDASILTLASAIYDTNGSMTEACIEPGWRVGDIILAARVLQGDSPAPSYRDEAEMRRVFGLVYDVLRFKQILNQALQNVGFWHRYSEHSRRERIVWLLLYDMQGRKFSRGREVALVKERERAFRDAGIKSIEDALIETRTRLAASVTRLRIGGSALALDELLPAHLRTAEGVNWSEDGASLASGWVNTIKISSRAEFIGEMAKLDLRLCVNCNETELDEDRYVFDPICPKVVNLHDKAREKLAMSDLVMSHRFVFLERSLCLGAAALAQTIRCGRLCGPVVLTHSIAPRHTGYLAGLIADIEDAGRLLAFGTGDQRLHYEQYLGKLGFTSQQCRVFSERYVSPPPSAELERATVVLCPPPCSYTGVRDVVDLAVARGGDTRLLENLTNINIALEHPRSLLTEQLTSLKYALTRPNVQLLIYEAHSILPSETFEMVDQVVQYANRIAADKHTREHPRKKSKPMNKEATTKVGKSSKSGKRRQSVVQNVESQEDRRTLENEDAPNLSSTDLEVPESDIFEVTSTVDVFGSGSANWLNEGCYLAVIKRKEMMQFNSLFMIKVAESKGLFGDRAKQSKDSFKENQRAASPIRQGSQDSSRKAIKRPKIQVERIAAATQSSILRSSRGKRKDREEEAVCPKQVQHVAQDQSYSRSQTSQSSDVSLKTSNRPTTIIEKPELPREEKIGENLSRDRSSRPIFTEKTWRKNSKFIISPDVASDLLRVFTAEKTSLPPPPRESRRSQNNGIRDSSTFSFGYGARALADATQKISLGKKDLLEISEHEFDKENSWQYKFIRVESAKRPEAKISRLYHPGGSIKFSRPEMSMNPSSIRRTEYYQGFPYIFPGTGKAAAAAGLDNLSNN